MMNYDEHTNINQPLPADLLTSVLLEAIDYQLKNPQFSQDADLYTYNNALHLLASCRQKLTSMLFLGSADSYFHQASGADISNFRYPEKPMLFVQSMAIDPQKTLSVRVHLENTARIENGQMITDYKQKTLSMVAKNYIVLALPIKKDMFKKVAVPVIGSYNHIMATSLDKREGVLLLPFEQVTWVSLPQLGTVTKEFAYCNNPLHSCFYHLLEPACVTGFAVDAKAKNMMAFVSQPKLLNIALKDMPALTETHALSVQNHNGEYDSSSDIHLALQLFKERYKVPVSEDALEKLQQFDQQVAGLDVNTPAFNLTIDQ